MKKNNKKRVFLSYVKAFDSDGCFYNQRIRIDGDTMLKLKQCIEMEILLGFPRKKEYVMTSGGEIYLERLSSGGGKIFLNHTQTRYINLFLKLPLLDRNTYIFNK
jgi:hypothetical protein